MPDRRDFLQVLSTLPALGVFPPDATQRVAGAAARDYFKELGVGRS
jgi:hypothetical protein